jgi:hypothetical protein
MARAAKAQAKPIDVLRVPDDAWVASLHDLQEGAGERAI